MLTLSEGRCPPHPFAQRSMLSSLSNRPGQYGVRFKAPKSKSSRRFVPLSPESIKLLRAHKKLQDESKDTFRGAYTTSTW
jgi:hypothetical protein